MNINAVLSDVKQNPVLPAGLLLLAGLFCIAVIGREAGDFAISALTIMAVLSIQFDRLPFSNVGDDNYMFAGLVALIGIFTVKLIIDRLGVPIGMRSVPFFILLAYWGLQHGPAALQKYWRELLLLFMLGIPDRTLMTQLVKPFLVLFDMETLSHATASVATIITGVLSGWDDLKVIGTHIHAPNVISNVYQPCDGGRLVDFMLRLTVMLIVAFPVKRYKWLIILFISMSVGWLVNVGRVTAMVFIANTGDMAAFEYWHTGEGSKIFHLIAIILFCLVAYFQITPANSGKQKLSATQ